jgi:hypothetical protein
MAEIGEPAVNRNFLEENKLDTEATKKALAGADYSDLSPGHPMAMASLELRTRSGNPMPFDVVIQLYRQRRVADARKSYINKVMAKSLGINTPWPIGFYDRGVMGSLIVTEAFYPVDVLILRNIERYGNLELQPETQREIMETAVSGIAIAHDKRVFHLDVGRIAYTAEGRALSAVFWGIDEHTTVLGEQFRSFPFGNLSLEDQTKVRKYERWATHDLAEFASHFVTNNNSPKEKWHDLLNTMLDIYHPMRKEHDPFEIIGKASFRSRLLRHFNQLVKEVK